MEVIRAVLALRPRRRIEVLPSEQHRFVVASDAAEHVPGDYAGGFLLVLWRTGLPAREAVVAEVSPSVHSLFTPGDHKIAQLELSMVLYALTARASCFCGARGIRGVSTIMSQRIINLIHVDLFSRQTWIYLEWIPSKSN